jgi:hypothetical protein
VTLGCLSLSTTTRASEPVLILLAAGLYDGPAEMCASWEMNP